MILTKRFLILRSGACPVGQNATARHRIVESSPLPRYAVDKQELCSWMCLICGFIYSEAEGHPESGIAPGTRWADVPMNWTCPECGARKEDFEMVPV
jgi:rubredoxin